MKRIDYRKVFKVITLGALLVLTFLFAGMIYYLSFSSIHNSVVINEICSNNFNLITDDYGQYSDYIELYNPTDETVLLEGYFLSDDENQLQKFPLDTVSIPPLGYYVVWLNKDAELQETGSGFGISKYGETIYLSDSNSGEIIDSVPVPRLTYNTCYGRTEDGGAKWAEMTDTAGHSNADADILPVISLDAPKFSVESGFYNEPFEVVITAPEYSIIYYTLDGSNPTPDSYIYESPLAIDDVSRKENVYIARTDLSATRQYNPSFLVDKATVLRAVSYNAQDNTASEVVTKVYFVGYDDKSEYDNLPVISIVTDPDNLFDAEIGIYGNGAALEQYKADGGLQNGELLESFTDQNGKQHALYMASNAFKRGREWEREVTLSYFDTAHEFCFEQNVGIRISGGSTRSRQQKSLSLFGRDIYEENKLFPYEFFADTQYSTIKLRNGGNNNGTVMITDAFVEELAAGRDIAIQRSTPCILFLNGEYWGIYNIRERYTEEYLSNNFGVRENNVWIVENSIAKVGDNEAQEAYEFMIYLITECDLSYDDVYDMICGTVDIQSLIDYYCINLYVGNVDVSFNKNFALWRTIEPEDEQYGDGKWRWMHYDMDISLRSHDDVSWMQDNKLMIEPVMISMMKNEQFRKQFCLTFMDIANTNYAYDRVHEKLTEWEEIYKEQIVKTNQCFVDENFSEEMFHECIAEIDDFFKNRFSFAAESLAYAFDLTGELEVITVENIDSEKGTVTVNTAQLDGYGKWSGQYFTDYPVTLTAAPKDGYHFAGWRGDINSEENTLEIELPKGGIIVEAVFEKAD